MAMEVLSRLEVTEEEQDDAKRDEIETGRDVGCVLFWFCFVGKLLFYVLPRKSTTSLVVLASPPLVSSFMSQDNT